MALNNLGLGIVFTATDLASNVLRTVNKGFLTLDDTVTGVAASVAKRFGVSTQAVVGSLKQITGGLALATAGFMAFGGAMNLARDAGEFEYKMAAVNAVTKATVDQVARLEEAALRAGLATQFSPLEAAEGLLTLATAGQTAEQSMKTLIPVLDLAMGSMGQLGLEGAAEAVVGTLNAYQMSADQAAIVTDKLLKTTLITNFTTRDFEAGLAKAAATGAVFNQTLDDTLIAVGLLRNRNIDASSSATAYREATRFLGSDQRAQAALMSAGVKVFDESTGKIRSIIDVTMDLAEATRNMTDQERMRIVEQAYGARGLLAYSSIASAQFTTMRNGVEVTLEGREAIKALREEMEKAGGTADFFRRTLLDTFKGQKQLLTGVIQTLTVVLGKPFAQVFKPIVGALVDGLTKITEMLHELPMGAKRAGASFVVFGSIAAIVAGLGAVIGGLATLISGPLLAAIGAGAVAGLKLMAVVAGLTAVGYGLYQAWQSNFGGIRALVLPTLERIAVAMRSLIALFSQGKVEGPLAEILAGDKALFTFVDAISRAAAMAKAFLSGMAEAAMDVVSALSESLAPMFSEIGSLISEVFTLAVDVIRPFTELLGLTGPGDTAIDVLKTIGKIFGTLVLAPIKLFIQSLALGVRLLTFFARAGVFMGQGFVNMIGMAYNGLKQVLTVVTGPLVAGFAWLSTKWRSFVAALTSPWAVLAGSVLGIWRTIKLAVLGTVNATIDVINTLISAAARALAIISPGAAATLSGLKLGRFDYDENGDLRGSSGVAPAASQGPQGPSVGASTPMAGILPSSAPVTAPQDRPVTRAEMRALVEEAIRGGGSERGQPIVVQGDVVMDGTRVGRVNAARERDQRARVGRISGSRSGGW